MTTRTLSTAIGALPAGAAMAMSRSALDRPLACDAELSVVALTTAATVLGAFQRHHGLPTDLPLVRRVSGGPHVRIGPGTLHVLLALSDPTALMPCDARRLVNRYVRPLRRALTKAGALTHYFGREWISAGHRPVGQVGFAHDSRTGRAVFEAFVAVSTPFALAGRASFLGKEPVTLDALVDRAIDVEALATRIVEAYADEAERSERTALAAGEAPVEPWIDPPWAAIAEEAIGDVCAGQDARGVLRLGGDLLASRDALVRVADSVAGLPDDASVDAIGAVVDAELTASGVAVDGVRDLASIRDVLRRAR